MEEFNSNCPHKSHKTGGKVNKKKLKEKKDRHNPKAFSFSGGVVSVERKARRALDIETKRASSNHLNDKIPIQSPPPIIVVVQGPKGVGKSTLIRSLVKHYTHQNIVSIDGPITLVSGRNRRLTFIECQNNISNMLDLAKVVDLALVMIDGSFGFEMETFEFINMLQVHGFPQIIGVLSHLDSFDDSKLLKNTKKKIKKRFWAEIFDGAKLFYLSKLQFNRYSKNEIQNLARFISIQKIKPLSFKSQRSYIVPLRHICHPTSSQDESCSIDFFGYVNGSTLRNGITMHIPGLGDIQISNVSLETDPCPLVQNTHPTKNKGKSLRTLKLHDRNLYAPQCDVRHISYDNDELIISIPNFKVNFTPSDKCFFSSSDNENDVNKHKFEENSNLLTDSIKMVRELQNAEEFLDHKVQKMSLKLLPTSYNPVQSTGNAHTYSKERVRRPATFSQKLDSGSNDVDNDSTCETSSLSFKNKSGYRSCNESLSESNRNENTSLYSDECSISEDDTKVNSNYYDIPYINSNTDKAVDFETHNTVYSDSLIEFRKHPNLFDIIYYPNKLNLVTKKPECFEDVLYLLGSLVYEYPTEKKSVSNERCHLGNYTTTLLIEDDANSDENNHCLASLIYTNLNIPCLSLKNEIDFWENSSIRNKLKKTKFITGLSIDNAANDEDTHDECAKKNDIDLSEKSETLDSLKLEIYKQQEESRRLLLTLQESLQEARQLVEDNHSGFVIGQYVKVTVHQVPIEWEQSYKSSKRACIIGGLLPGEDTSCGIITAHIQKHRWTPKILKTNDPLLFSFGWRRFQSIPMFAIEDRNNVRVRMLKYTPEHLHSLLYFYGPIQAPNTGILAIRNWDANIKGYRISATGISVESSREANIVKKLKLIGEPYKILKNTAFIRKMFNSSLEVTKCLGCKIQTVSGIRGQIKKPKGLDGLFRATFEDKVLMSDIVVFKAWIKVNPILFCHPMMDIPTWKKLRCMTEIRNDMKIPPPDATDTSYGKKPVRVPRKFNPVKIPKEIEKSLPFASISKNELPKRKPKGLVAEATAIESDPHSKKVQFLLNRLHLISKERLKERKAASKKYREEKLKKIQQDEERRKSNRRESKKRKCVIQSKKNIQLRKRLKV